MDYTCYRCGTVKDDSEGVFIDRLAPSDNSRVVICGPCAARSPEDNNPYILTFSNYFNVVNVTEFILWLKAEWPGFKVRTLDGKRVMFSRDDAIFFMGDMPRLRQGIQKRLSIHSSCIITDIAHRNAHCAVITRSKYENINMTDAALTKAQEILKDPQEKLDEEPVKRKILA